jgi:hypothetical protein
MADNYPFPGGPLTDEPKGGSAGDITDLSPGGGGESTLLVPTTDTTSLIAQWNFDGDYTDSGGSGYDLEGNTFRDCPLNPTDATYVCAEQLNGNLSIKDTTAVSQLQLKLGLTVGMWVWVKAYETGNCPLFGNTGVGAGADENVTWALYINNDGTLFTYWQHGTNQANLGDNSVATVPLNTWTYVSMTRNAAGTAATAYIDDTAVVTTTGLNTATNGEVAKTNVMVKWDGDHIPGAFFCLTVRDAEYDAAEIAALRSSHLVDSV